MWAAVLVTLAIEPATQIMRGEPIDLAVLREIDLVNRSVSFALPLELEAGQPKAIAALYSSDAEIDPYIGMFSFPRAR